MNHSSGKTVLICDDEPNIREAICYAVERAGLKCIQAHDGNDAYAKALSERPDLIVLDIGMPGMTGLEVCTRLRADESFAGIGIILLTAFGQAGDEQRAREAGASRFMVKPFSVRQLRETLQEMLA